VASVKLTASASSVLPAKAVPPRKPSTATHAAESQAPTSVNPKNRRVG
jgi:hypothetical protein